MILDNFKHLFEFSSEYLKKNMNNEDVRNELIELFGNTDVQIENNSISNILYHENDFYTNTYKIRLDIICNKKKIGYYSLYLDENKNVIDDFFVID